MFDDDATEEYRRSGRRGVSVPTVLASAGVSATISALIVTIGVVGILVSDDRGDSPSASAALPTVVNLGSAATQQGAAATAAPTQAAPSTAPSTAAGAADDSTTGGGAVGGGTTGGGTPGGGTTGGGSAGGGAAAGGSAGGGTTGGGAQATAPASPQALSAGQLDSKLRVLLSSSASRDAKAAELEGGAAGIPVADAVVRALKLFGATGFRWRVSAPISVSGSVLNARLITSAPGFNDLSQPISWVWKDGGWKLSNKSTCMLASYAQARCTV